MTNALDILDLHTSCASSHVFGCILVTLLQLNIQFVPKKERKKKTNALYTTRYKNYFKQHLLEVCDVHLMYGEHHKHIR